ncbi:MAG TPA: redoxin domain-containing protein [Burkholderiaceae bacterium]|nr:redoxin domain-containing protein [Burkholderiaceae bacterium]
MTTSAWIAVLAIAAVAATFSTAAQPVAGDKAPGFHLTDVDGHPVALEQFRGKFVVLEWNNPGCPFVGKHYRSGNMQSLQARETAAGVVWLTINSTNPGHADYETPAQWAAWIGAQRGAASDWLPDPQGGVGRSYRAKTTPQMFVIDPGGTIVYSGAIDDRPSTDVADIAGARNYVEQALREARAGKPVSTPSTVPYGCSVKYG